MSRSVIRIAVFAALFSVIAICAEGLEVRFISPIGAVARSAVPGWGQVYTGDKLQGVIVFLSVGVLGGVGIWADAKFRHFYNDLYRPLALSGSSQADPYFDKSNEYYKLSRFLFYTAAGIWAYSAIDAYVDAHVYNSRQQALILDIDNKKLQSLK